MLTSEDQRALVGEANRAPSVHNTQPTRWRFHGECIDILLDPARMLSVGDPQGFDAGISVGAAIEGTVLALSRRGIGVVSYEDFWPSAPIKRVGAPTLVARIITGGSAEPDPLAEHVAARFTWRGMFDPASAESVDRISEELVQGDYGIAVTARTDLEMLAELNDRLSLRVLRNRAYREELVSCMRLSPGHPDWGHDGMNLNALRFSRLEGLMARIALSYPVFEIAARLGLGKALVSERKKTLSASGALLVTQPAEHSPLSMGRALYRAWLKLTKAGFSVWPMAVLSDDSEGVAICSERFTISPTHRFINTLRFGLCPEGARPESPRHDPGSLIITTLPSSPTPATSSNERLPASPYLPCVPEP